MRRVGLADDDLARLRVDRSLHFHLEVTGSVHVTAGKADRTVLFLELIDLECERVTLHRVLPREGPRKLAWQARCLRRLVLGPTECRHCEDDEGHSNGDALMMHGTPHSGKR